MTPELRKRFGHLNAGRVATFAGIMPQTTQAVTISPKDLLGLPAPEPGAVIAVVCRPGNAALHRDAEAVPSAPATGIAPMERPPIAAPAVRF